MPLSAQESYEIDRMFEIEGLNIRCVTMGISLLDCVSDRLNGPGGLIDKIKSKIYQRGESLVEKANEVSNEYGIRIANKRIAVTPISLVAGNRSIEEYVEIAKAVEDVAHSWDKWNVTVEGQPEVRGLNWATYKREYKSLVAQKKAKPDFKDGVSFIGGYSALVHKGWTDAERAFISSIPIALKETDVLCSSVNVATTRAGINMDAVRRMGEIIKQTAEITPDSVGCAKFVVFANAVEDNPFMAGAFHGIGEPECVINIGISGPEVVRKTVVECHDADFMTLAEKIKRTIFKVVRAGELVGNQMVKKLPSADFGIIDLSLAPVPKYKNHPEVESVAAIIEEMGIERCGAPGTLAALALLIDAVKRGGAMASSRVGGLSGTFIPVSEDLGMVRAAREGALTLERVEAMTSVCSVGLDMVAIPGDTPATTISAIIADEMAIGVINNKTTAARIIPVSGKSAGDHVDWTPINPLLGEMDIMAIFQGRPFSSEKFIRASAYRIPAPITSLTN